MGPYSETFLEETPSDLLCESVCISEASDSRHGNAGVIWATEHLLYVDVIFMVHVFPGLPCNFELLFAFVHYIDHKPNNENLLLVS